MAFSFLIILLSMFGNSLVIIAVTKNIGHGGHMSYFICNLSVSDFAMGVVPFLNLSIESVLNESILGHEWTLTGILGQVRCKMHKFSLSALSLVSIFWVLAISINRACAILFPLKNLITKGVARVIVVLVWTLPCAYASHAFYFYDTVTIEDQTKCIFTGNDEKIDGFKVRYLFHAILLLVTLLALLILYTTIVVKFWFTTIPGQQNTAAQQRRKKTNRKVLAMLVILVVSFYFWNLPALLLVISFFSSNFSDLYLALAKNNAYRSSAGFLVLSNGSINTYIILSSFSFKTSVEHSKSLLRRYFFVVNALSIQAFLNVWIL